MNPQSKAREFWVSPDRVITTEVHYEIEGAIETDCFCASDDPLDSDAIHVIEKSAYDKAVEALKWIKRDIKFDRLEDVIITKIDETLRELGVV